jgi:hypothetical protein
MADGQLVMATTQAYHLVNERSLPMREVVQHLNDILGVELTETSYDEWRSALCDAPETNVLLPLAAAFRPNGFPTLDRIVDCSNTLEALRSLPTDDGAQAPLDRPQSSPFTMVSPRSSHTSLRVHLTDDGPVVCPKLHQAILARYLAHLRGLGFLQRT